MLKKIIGVGVTAALALSLFTWSAAVALPSVCEPQAAKERASAAVTPTPMILF
jgi:hypothetical protein